jgi:hypothetical protein
MQEQALLLNGLLPLVKGYYGLKPLRNDPRPVALLFDRVMPRLEE